MSRHMEEALQLLRREYAELPGLKLTVRKLARILTLDDPTCEAILEALVHTGFLSRTPDGCYVRAASTLAQCH